MYVGRFVPENSIDILINSFKDVKTQKKLVIVGDAPYSDEYKKSLFKLASNDSRIIFTGYAFDQDYDQLSTHAYFYVQPAGIDGTRPALLDQMGFGNCVLVRNSTVNMEVISDCGVYFHKDNLQDSLTIKMQALVDNPNVVLEYRERQAVLEDAKERKLSLMMEPEDYNEFYLITVLRHEKNDLYILRLENGKNIISVSSKFIVMKEVK